MAWMVWASARSSAQALAADLTPSGGMPSRDGHGVAGLAFIVDQARQARLPCAATVASFLHHVQIDDDAGRELGLRLIASRRRDSSKILAGDGDTFAQAQDG